MLPSKASNDWLLSLRVFLRVSLPVSLRVRDPFFQTLQVFRLFQFFQEPVLSLPACSGFCVCCVPEVRVAASRLTACLHCRLKTVCSICFGIGFTSPRFASGRVFSEPAASSPFSSSRAISCLISSSMPEHICRLGGLPAYRQRRCVPRAPCARCGAHNLRHASARQN